MPQRQPSLTGETRKVNLLVVVELNARCLLNITKKFSQHWCLKYYPAIYPCCTEPLCNCDNFSYKTILMTFGLSYNLFPNSKC